MDQELERLLKEVLGELKDLTKNLKGSGRAVVSFAGTLGKTKQVLQQKLEAEKKQMEGLKKGTAEYVKQSAQVAETTEAMEEFESATKKASKSQQNFVQKLVGFAKDIVLAGGRTALAFSDATNPIRGTSDVVEAALKDSGVAADVAKAMARDLDMLTGNFVQLSQTGAMFNGSLMSISKAAADAAIPLPKFVDLIAENSELLGAFFGTVQAGANRVVQLGRKLNDLSTNELAGFGISAEDAGGFLTTFVEGERRRGVLKNFTDTQLLNGTKAYIKQLQDLSVLTGKSVKELDEQNKAAMADAVFNQKLAGMDQKAASAIRAQFASMNPQMQEFTKQIIAFRGPINQAGFELEVLTGGKLTRAVNQFIDNAADPNATLEFQNAFGQISKDVREGGGALADLSILTGDFTNAFQALNDSIRKQVDESELDQIFERLSTSGQKAVGVLNNFDKTSADLIDKRLQMTIPPTLAVFDNLSGVVARMTDPPDGALYKFGQTIQQASTHLQKLLGLDTPENSEKDLDERFYEFGKPIVNFFKNKVGTDQAPGKGTVFSLADDSIFGSVRRGGEAVGEFFNSDFFNTLPKMQRGSNGVQDFGTGTAAILHGREAVITEDQLNKMAKELIAFGMPVTNQMQNTTAMTSEFMNAFKALNMQSTNLARSPAEVAQTDPDTLQSAAQPNMLEKHIEDLNKTSVSMNQNLNTLVQLASMTERNTKNTTNSLANMSGSVV